MCSCELDDIIASAPTESTPVPDASPDETRRMNNLKFDQCLHTSSLVRKSKSLSFVPLTLKLRTLHDSYIIWMHALSLQNRTSSFDVSCERNIRGSGRAAAHIKGS
eukprot:3135795-Amphidinium_carterae.4